MLIEGEKYACDACVRGHRVSNCQHYDRPLQHINKKGRPVSQCQVCRAMRKSRSTHVKCDCGEKPSKCPHLQPTLEGHTETCCCNHGGRCTCCGQKDSGLVPVCESDSEHETHTRPMTTKAKPTIRRRRANTVHTDGLSLDQASHHKQKVKHNRASSKIGPYHLNRANSAHSAGAMIANAEGGGLPGAEHTMGDDMADRPQRRVRSEATSPLMAGSSFASMNGLTPLDLSGTEYQPYMSNDSFSLYSAGVESEYDAPMFSAGLTASSVDWSNFNLDRARSGFVSSSYGQLGPHGLPGPWDYSSGSDHVPNLTNTTTTSGEVSEVEDFAPGNDGDYEGFAHAFGHSSSGMVGQTADLTSIDYDSFYKPGDNGSMSGCSVSMVEDDPAFWMPNYNERVPTADENTETQGQPSLSDWTL